MVRLRELRIKNLALISDANLTLAGDFSVFTGETGAGKSILIGAIGLVLGERASGEQIRTGADEADVSALFDLSTPSRLLDATLKELNVPVDDNTLIVRRIISRSGRNRTLVNQVPLPLAALKQLGDQLIDFHGQHEHQLLLQLPTHQGIIDSLAPVAPVRKSFDITYVDFIDAQQALIAHDKRTADLAIQRDLLEFQQKELAELQLTPGLEQELEAELALLSSSTDRVTSAASIMDLLDSDDGIESRIGQVRKVLTNLTRFDASATPWVAELDHASSTMAELGRFCRGYIDQADAIDPQRIEQVNARLAKIQRLKKKYRCDCAGLMQKKEQVALDLASMENADADRDLLQKKVATARVACLSAAIALRKARSSAARDFDKQVTARLRNLGFIEGEWKTELRQLDEPGADGTEEIEFLVRTNKGELLLPLARTASGGEISRCMLAIKSVLASQDMVPILIFDEIDTGIGGTLAHAVAQALAELSVSHQVLCISHLHQIAAIAHQHVHVYKEISSGRTVTRIESLTTDQRITEIARMLGGDTEIARTHARELLRQRPA